MLCTNLFKGESVEPNQKTKVLYDGECKLCKVEISGLKWLTRKKADVEFVDIASPDYKPSLFSGVTYEQAMKEMHVVGPQGQIYTQGDAIRQMYRASGLGWLASLTELPWLKDACDRLYIRFAHYRLQKAFSRCDSESNRCSIKLHNLRNKMRNSS
ncbi:thiol-disulfide oxidoreductase dcc [Plakobranchus ocellatus]|uniref:Thiol-disulfide oxidoreductase dcc n=1 Tax=Plakobranchus ocellatus TaxID=259542 RepID=A0AAV4AIS3_9GAST|nr:thiol-disulfide oxidoreductase dcc [Plakobranchus ocellatus]